MKSRIGRLARARYIAVALCAGALVATTVDSTPRLRAEAAQAASPVPNLAGVWDGTGRAHPINSETIPWARTVAVGRTLPDGTKADANYVSNFPVLNERGLAFQKIFDEPLSPTKGMPSSSRPRRGNARRPPAAERRRAPRPVGATVCS